MRENCTYGLTRGRAHPTRGVPLYSTTPSLFLAQQLELLKLRNSLMASINFRITTPLLPHHWGPTLVSPYRRVRNVPTDETVSSPTWLTNRRRTKYVVEAASPDSVTVPVLGRASDIRADAVTVVFSAKSSVVE